MTLYYKQNSHKRCIKTEFCRVSAHTLVIKHAILAQGGVTSLQRIYIFSENQLSQPTKHYLAWSLSVIRPFLRTKAAFQLVLSVKSHFLRTGQPLQSCCQAERLNINISIPMISIALNAIPMFSIRLSALSSASLSS